MPCKMKVDTHKNVGVYFYFTGAADGFSVCFFYASAPRAKNMRDSTRRMANSFQMNFKNAP